MKTPSKDSALDSSFVCLRQKPFFMAEGHRHQDVELNVLHRGWVEYAFGGRRRRLKGGQVAVFWAALPHQITAFSKDAEYQNVHLPLGIFLQWNLPGDLSRRLLGGEVVVVKSRRPKWEEEMFAAWNQDRGTNDPEASENIFLELQAYLRRLARDPVLKPEKDTPGRYKAEIRQVDEMARFVSEQYSRPVTVKDIAAAAGLNSAYAMTLFKRQFGMTLGDCLTRHRLAHAQRLLATTDRKVLDIALDSGFGSESRFYKVFQERCGEKPKDYRKRLRE